MRTQMLLPFCFCIVMGCAPTPPVASNAAEPHAHGPQGEAPHGAAPHAHASTGDHEPEADPHAPSAPATPASAPNDAQATYERAKPVFAKHCAGCHTTDGHSSSKKGLTHFDMSSYPFGGHHADEIAKTIRASVGAAGKPATMPKDQPGSVKGDELAAIVAWADAVEAESQQPQKHENHGKGDHKHDADAH